VFSRTRFSPYLAPVRVKLWLKWFYLIFFGLLYWDTFSFSKRGELFVSHSCTLRCHGNAVERKIEISIFWSVNSITKTCFNHVILVFLSGSYLVQWKKSVQVRLWLDAFQMLIDEGGFISLINQSESDFPSSHTYSCQYKTNSLLKYPCNCSELGWINSRYRTSWTDGCHFILHYFVYKSLDTFSYANKAVSFVVRIRIVCLFVFLVMFLELSHIPSLISAVFAFFKFKL
jgi:hypothetical protein